MKSISDQRRRHKMFGPQLLACALFLALAANFGVVTARAAEAITVAVFDFELLDTSLEGEAFGAKTAEGQRLVLISDLLRKMLAESGRYTPVDIAPAKAEITDAGYLHSCNGCDAKIARGLGAARALTGLVQKVSNLILNINLYLRDAENGELLRVMSADIRGNTDKSWSRGVSWLVRNRLLKE